VSEKIYTAQKGQAAVEYLIGCLVITALLTVPIAGHESALALFLDSIRVGFQRFLTALSVP
jgi:hypothetical protein